MVGTWPVLDPGAYSLEDGFSATAGTFDTLVIISVVHQPESILTYGTGEAMGQTSLPADPRVRDTITGGTISVSKAGEDYMFSWNFTTSDCDTLSGSYTGPEDL